MSDCGGGGGAGGAEGGSGIGAGFGAGIGAANGKGRLRFSGTGGIDNGGCDVDCDGGDFVGFA